MRGPLSEKSLWIWYPGDFEIYHHLVLNTRREEREWRWPAFWRLDDCYHNVRFRKRLSCEQPEEMTVYAHGIGHAVVDGKKHPLGQLIKLERGEHEIIVHVARPEGLPCVYVEGGQSASNASWEANEFGFDWLPAGCSDRYADKNGDPGRFAFHYEAIEPQWIDKRHDGIVYDYGKETFAALTFERIHAPGGIRFSYGESLEEALDTEHSILIDEVPAGSKSYQCPARAFRYVFVYEAEEAQFELTARYEYLPLTRRGSFVCSNDALNRIWETAEYTFHLNSREFFLDGIKRDRWVWSGDAYQSYLINHYLYFDTDIAKRTIIALRGKDPIAAHINTILDYSFFWLMSVYDYYQATKDLAFIRFMYPRMKSMMDYCVSLADEDGFIRGREGDWVFVDWAEIDKTGAVCAEQMLFAQSLKATWACGELLGAAQPAYLERHDRLKDSIRARFWDEELGAYIDSFESGARHVTRHANIFALLWGFAVPEQRQSIIANVLLSDAVPPISTPYFKFYELEAMCLIGQLEEVTGQMEGYWGGMLQLGATTFWEEYDPSVSGAERFGMYGDRYGKSLCHAWGASPIYLLGRYYLGVYPTSPGYETFAVEPQLGGLDWIEGTVPVNQGQVSVKLTGDTLSVTADQDGGVVRFQGREYTLAKNVQLQVQLG